MLAYSNWKIYGHKKFCFPFFRAPFTCMSHPLAAHCTSQPQEEATSTINKMACFHCKFHIWLFYWLEASDLATQLHNSQEHDVMESIQEPMKLEMKPGSSSLFVNFVQDVNCPVHLRSRVEVQGNPPKVRSFARRVRLHKLMERNLQFEQNRSIRKVNPQSLELLKKTKLWQAKI